MATPPVNAIEWLYNKIKYAEKLEDVREYALMLIFSCGDADIIQDYYQEELDEEGYFQNYSEREYLDGSERFEDEDESDAWDTAIEFEVAVIKRRVQGIT